MSSSRPMPVKLQCSAPSLVSTTCPYCGVGCGVDVAIIADANADKKLTDLKGSSDHPANFGRLCVKGSKLLESNALSGRLLSPLIGGKITSWDEAIIQVANKFNQVIAEHGPDSVAFYVSGQLLTEDYYVANKLMKGYIGSANIDTNSRLCMSSAVAAYKRAFGADAVPCCYEDLEQAELLILVGSNAAWTHPVLFQRIERAKKLNPDMQVVTIDPRRTATSELADIHLAIKPGTDVALFNGLLAYLAAHDALDINYISAHTQGVAKVLNNCAPWTLAKVAKQCDISELELLSFYKLFCQTDKVVTAYCMGVNQSSSGTDKASSIINSHLATGKIGREGCGPFSLTGQPNAMGGREVGGLANMLACHMNIENPEHRQTVQNYWQSPSIAHKPGLKAVDLFENINNGKIKAVWIMATNPMVSMPNSQKIADALKKCELVVVSDCVEKNDTLDYADIALPATGWSEKDGTVTNSERRISRQRGLLPASGEAKHDWQIICDVAKAMGFTSGFNFDSPSEIFSEYTGLTQADNQGRRDLDLSALCDMTETQYNRLKPVQWPVNRSAPNGTKRLFTDGKFYTKSRKAQFVVTEFAEPEQLTSNDFPFVLNSGRVRDQWHTMTRTGKTSELTAHINRPYLSIHAKDAESLALHNHDLVSLSAAHFNSTVHFNSSEHFKGTNHFNAKKNRVLLPIVIDNNQRQGEVFAPIHWSASNASSATITALYTDANDKISGQPELKHAAVKIQKFSYQHNGQLFIQQDIKVELLREYFDYFVTSPVENGQLVFFATDKEPATIKRNLQLQFPLNDEWVSASSIKLSSTCAMRQGVMSLIMLIAPNNIDVDPNWIDSLLNSVNLTSEQLHGLLNMQPDEQFKQGKLVCSCFKVGENTIIEAIKAGCDSADSLGRELKCGTNCGSCKSELSQMVKQHKPNKHVIEQDPLIALEAV
jgi:assimilatory nitrate reductase catalytic subunit